MSECLQFAIRGMTSILIELAQTTTTMYFLSLPALAVAIPVGYVLFHLGYNLFFHPLRGYPGPLLWRASSLPWKIALLRGTMHHDLMRFHQKYGDTVRIKPDEISYANAQAWRDIHAHVPGRPEFLKDPVRLPLAPNGVMSILVSDTKNHARFRSLFGHAFSDKGLRTQESTILQYADLLVEVLREVADTGRSAEMVYYFNMAIFDSIGALSFGESFDSLKSRQLHPWVDAIHKNLKSVAISHVLRSMGIEFLTPYVLPKELRGKRQENYSYAVEKLNKRMKMEGDQGDFWDKVLVKSADDNQRGDGMSAGEMLNNAAVMVVAGSETTASALSGAMYLLCLSGKIEKATAEIRKSFASPEEIDLISVSHLPYLTAVIDETLRMYPAVPGQPPRVVPAGGATVCGRFVPEETRVGVSHLGAYFADYNFTHADKFIPERHLQKREEPYKYDNYGAYQPWSVGLRNCIGRNLAYAEVRLTLAKLLWHFDFTLDVDKTGKFLDQKIWSIWAKRELYMFIKKRGPRWWAIWRGPYILSNIRGSLVRDLQRFHQQFGPVVRIAPDELSFIVPEAASPIYTSNPEFPKDAMHLPPFHNGTPGILAADHAHHRRYRRLLALSFSEKGLRQQRGLIERSVDLLITRLHENCGQGPLDLTLWFNWATFDIIGDLAFGDSFGCLDNVQTHPWIASIQGNVKLIPILNGLRRYRLDGLLRLLGSRKLLEQRRRNAQFTTDQVDRRLQNSSTPRGDIWDAVLAQKPDGEPPMSREEMISNASAIVLAGSETSATLLSGCTWLLLKNPAHLHQLTSRIRSQFTHASEIDSQSVSRVEGLQAVLEESLRLYPPVPMQSNRIVPQAGAYIAGRWVPGGTSVGLQQFVACRSSSNFHRPDEFLPERWQGQGEFAPDRREVSQPFSIGPRNCIGRQLAYVEMRLMLVKLLWHFDLRLDTTRMKDTDWLAEQGIWILWDKKPLWVTLEPRNKY
ncbi:cytochrome P450 [Aspergillus transmontanensis]|uniref:Cytochrome P450 n=1 Tax=Aspergillus transmontanensis TaxID=1034304 RepID=A0A5N6VPV3_9EURO|nr:cytochrome P450 [Aspergillus transmontanensis]